VGHATATNDPRQRFTDRVDDYVRYRPDYPAAVCSFLAGKAGLGRGSWVADIGAGTGIFTRQLLDTGASVYAVEPNDAMRAAAVAAIGGRPGFRSLPGSAEATGLPDRSVDLITCAQSFHWFDVARSRREFGRILTPAGWCALVWNTAQDEASEFMRGYRAIRQSVDPAQAHHDRGRRDARCDELYGAGRWERHGFDHAQTLDFAALCGRLMSASYAPREGHPARAPLMTALRQLFERCQDERGRVTLTYVTQLYVGRLAAEG